MRHAIALPALLLAAATLRAEPLPPVLCTFGNTGPNGGAATLTSRFPWRGAGEHLWNRVGAAAADLPDATGAATGIALASTGTLCGTGGVLLKSQFPGRDRDFPQAPVTDASTANPWNGGVLNAAGGCAFTLSGLDPASTYTLTVLAGRGNAWESGVSAYAIDAPGATLRYAENASGAASLEQDTASGAWLVFAHTFTGRTSVTLSAVGGAGNFNAFALERERPERLRWADPAGGDWGDASKWAGRDVGGDPWLLDLDGAEAPVVIAYAPAEEPATLRWAASATAYVLDGARFGCAFVDGTVAKDGPGTVTLAGDSTADFDVAEGTLRVGGSVAGTVSVAAGAAISGAGRVGRLVLADGAVIDPTSGTLTADAVAADGPDLPALALPDGAARPRSATVTVRVGGAAPGLILRCAGLPEGIRFEPAARLRVTDEGLALLPAEGTGYRLSVR